MPSQRSSRNTPGILPALLLLGALSLPVSAAQAETCGVLPFSADSSVDRGAADNITSLVSTEVDIRGGFDLVLTASTDEIKSTCGKDVSCVKNFGQDNAYDQVVAGHVGATGSDSYKITVKLFKSDSGSLTRSATHVVSRSPDLLLDGIPDLVVELLTGEKPSTEEEEEDLTGEPLFDEAGFDEEEDLDDFGDLDESDASSEGGGTSGKKNRPGWMKRDRRGRAIADEADTEAASELDDLDDLDDLDLDDITVDAQRKKAKDREDKLEKERLRQAEEDRLAALAEAEAARKAEERRRAEREREQEKRRQAEEDRRRREEEERARLSRERRDRERADRERRDARDRERRAREREEEDRRRAERSRAREREDRQARERRLAEERERQEDDRRSESIEDFEDDLSESGATLGSAMDTVEGLIMVEDDDEDVGFIIEDDDSGEEEEDVYEDPGVARRAAARERERNREDDRRLAYNDDESRERDRYSDARSSGYSRRSSDRDDDQDDRYSRSTSPREERQSNDDDQLDRLANGSFGSRSSQARAKTGKRDGPWLSVKLGAGWTAYYPETLKLGMFDYGIEASILALPALSVDVGANFWAVSLVEFDDQGEPVRTVRTLPTFFAGASWRGTFHKVIRPYVGVDIGALLYAQAVVNNASGTQVQPLFAPVVNADFGCDFILHRNIGLFVGAKAGVTHAARIQETVNSNWTPTTGLLSIWAGVIGQL